MLDALRRRAGIERYPCHLAGGLDRLNGPVDMRPRLDMGGDHIGPRLGIGLDIGIDGRDHQVHVHEGRNMRAKGFDRGGAEGQVRHEMPVHHIDMDPIGALGFDRADLGAEIGEIGRENRGGNLDRTVE